MTCRHLEASFVSPLEAKRKTTILIVIPLEKLLKLLKIGQDTGISIDDFFKIALPIAKVFLHKSHFHFAIHISGDIVNEIFE